MTTGPEAWGATLLRLILGVVYLTHGWYAVAVVGLSALAGYMPRMGYPPAVAPLLGWYLVVGHLVGGALMVLGVWTRAAALLQVPIMASAVFLLHSRRGST